VFKAGDGNDDGSEVLAVLDELQRSLKERFRDQNRHDVRGLDECPKTLIRLVGGTHRVNIGQSCQFKDGGRAVTGDDRQLRPGLCTVVQREDIPDGYLIAGQSLNKLN